MNATDWLYDLKAKADAATDGNRMTPKDQDAFAFKLYDLARAIGSRYNTGVDVVVPQRRDHACMCYRCVGRRVYAERFRQAIFASASTPTSLKDFMNIAIQHMEWQVL